MPLPDDRDLYMVASPSLALADFISTVFRPLPIGRHAS